MSLTTMLKGNNDSCDELKRIISIIEINKNLKDNSDAIMKVKYSLTDHTKAGLLGTAFDYLARFVIKHNTNGIHSIEEEYTSSYGLDILKGINCKNVNTYTTWYKEGLKLLDRYIKDKDTSIELFDRIIGVSYYFAKLENIYRSGYSDYKESLLRESITEEIKNELKDMIEIFNVEFENKFNISSKGDDNFILYNPHFQMCSIAIGGADADIIINDTLIDFKTSKKLDNAEEDFKQLVGYYIFNKITRPFMELNKICLYQARYGRFVEYEFADNQKDQINDAIEQMKIFLELDF